MKHKTKLHNIIALFTATALSLSSIPANCIAINFLAPPSFSDADKIEMGSKKFRLSISDLGSFGAVGSRDFTEGVVVERIKHDMKYKRYIKIFYDFNSAKGVGEFKITKIGKGKLDRGGIHGMGVDAATSKMLLELNANKELKDHLNEKRLSDFSVVLLETFETLPAADHPHLLAVQNDKFMVAYSGTGQGTGHNVYITQSAFRDYPPDIVAEIIMQQADVCIGRHQAFFTGAKAPMGTSTDATSKLLGKVRVLGSVRDELIAVHNIEVATSREYEIPELHTKAIISYWSKLADKYPDAAPIQTNLNRAKSFKKRLEGNDYPGAIRVWGYIMREMRDLESHFKSPDSSADPPEYVKFMFQNRSELLQTELFFSISKIIDDKVQDYIEEKGIRIAKLGGMQAGQAVGIVRIIKDPKDTDEAFDNARGNEIWVVPSLPTNRPDIPGIGIIVGVGGNTHAIGTAIEQGIPLGIITNAGELLKGFDGKPGMFRVEGDGSQVVRTPFSGETTILRKREKVLINIPQAKVDDSEDFIDLVDVDKYFTNYVGPKTANLGNLINAGYDYIPPGFGCSYAFCNKFFEANNGLREKIAELRGKLVFKNNVLRSNDAGLTVKAVLKEIRDLIINAEFPEELENAYLNRVQKACEQWNISRDLPKETPVSPFIRGAYNFEDLIEISMSGHYDSYPNTKALPDTSTPENRSLAFKMVLAAKYNEKAYRAYLINEVEVDDVMPSVTIHMPVPVGKKGNSGMMYTVDPTSHKLKVVMHGSSGFGETTVSGLGESAHIVVDKLTGRVDIIREESVIDAKVVESDGHLELRDITAGERAEAIFTDELIETLMLYGKDIEGQYRDWPQDIEWVQEIDDNGNPVKVWIVQTRPVVTGVMPTGKPALHDIFSKYLEKVEYAKLRALLDAKHASNTAKLIDYLCENPILNHVEEKDHPKYITRAIAADYLSSLALNDNFVANLTIEDINKVIEFFNAKNSVGEYVIHRDYYSLPYILSFLCRVLERTTENEERNNAIKKLFLQLGNDDSGMVAQFMHFSGMEIARALIYLKKPDLAVNVLKNPAGYQHCDDDVAELTINILKEIPTVNSMRVLREYSIHEALSPRVRNYALNVMGMIEMQVLREHGLGNGNNSLADKLTAESL